MVRDRDTFNVYRGDSESEEDSDESEGSSDSNSQEEIKECSGEDVSSDQAEQSGSDAASESSDTPVQKKKGKGGKDGLPSNVKNPFAHLSQPSATATNKMTRANRTNKANEKLGLSQSSLAPFLNKFDEKQNTTAKKKQKKRC